MNEKTPVPPSRGRFHGVWQIIRFNWTQYAGALATILLAVGWLVLGDGPAWLWFAALLTAILATTLIFTSLFASYWTYDLSDLYRWTWIVEVQPTPPHRWLNLHAGLDESSTALLRAFPCVLITLRLVPEPGDFSAKLDHFAILRLHAHCDRRH